MSPISQQVYKSETIYSWPASACRCLLIYQHIKHGYNAALGVNALKCIVPFLVPNSIYTAWHRLVSWGNLQWISSFAAGIRSQTIEPWPLRLRLLLAGLWFHVSVYTIVRHHASSISPPWFIADFVPLFPKYLERWNQTYIIRLAVMTPILLP